MALKFDINANARGAQAEVKDLGKALEDVGDSLDELAAEARSAERVERALGDVGDAGKDAAREIESAGDKIEGTFRDMVTDAKKADRAINDVGDVGSSSMGRVREGAQELQQEIGQNLGETVSSFRGDISDLGQVGQDTLGGLAATVAGTGPAGLLGAFALAAGAAGLGFFTAEQQKAVEKQEELNETAAKFAESMMTGIDGAIDASQLLAEIQAIGADPERYADAQKAVEEWGVSYQVAARAIAGDSTAVAIVQQTMADRTAKATELLAQQEKQTDGNAGSTFDFADAVERGQDRLDTLTGALEQGAEQARQTQQALYDVAVATGVATGETDDLGNAIIELPGGKQVVIDAKTKTAHENLDAIEQRNLADKSMTVRVYGDTSDFDRKMRDLQARANRGQEIVVPIRGGKVAV